MTAKSHNDSEQSKYTIFSHCSSSQASFPVECNAKHFLKFFCQYWSWKYMLSHLHHLLSVHVSAERNVEKFLKTSAYSTELTDSGFFLKSCVLTHFLKYTLPVLLKIFRITAEFLVFKSDATLPLFTSFGKQEILSNNSCDKK